MGSSSEILWKKDQSRLPIINPGCKGEVEGEEGEEENTRENPTINHKTDNTARPKNVCMIAESEFFHRSRPASNNPRAGVIIMTRAVVINIHVVSAGSIAEAAIMMSLPPSLQR